MVIGVPAVFGRVIGILGMVAALVIAHLLSVSFTCLISHVILLLAEYLFLLIFKNRVTLLLNCLIFSFVLYIIIVLIVILLTYRFTSLNFDYRHACLCQSSFEILEISVLNSLNENFCDDVLVNKSDDKH